MRVKGRTSDTGQKDGHCDTVDNKFEFLGDVSLSVEAESTTETSSRDVEGT